MTLFFIEGDGGLGWCWGVWGSGVGSPFLGGFVRPPSPRGGAASVSRGRGVGPRWGAWCHDMPVMTHRNGGVRGKPPRARAARHGLRNGACLMRRVLSFLVATAAWALGGCTPLTQYRYSAAIPAVRAIPFDGRTPAAT